LREQGIERNLGAVGRAELKGTGHTKALLLMRQAPVSRNAWVIDERVGFDQRAARISRIGSTINAANGTELAVLTTHGRETFLQYVPVGIRDRQQPAKCPLGVGRRDQS